MMVLINVLMIALGITLVVLWFLRRSNPNLGKPLIVGCALLLVGLSVVKMMTQGGATTPEAIARTQQRYDQACGEYLEQYIGDHYSSARVVLLKPPMPGPAGQEHPVLHYLEKALQGRVASVRIESLKVPDDVVRQFVKANSDGRTQGMEQGLEMLAANSALWMSPDHLADKLTTLAPSTDLVVCALPMINVDLVSLLPAAGEMPGIVLLYAPEDELDRLFEFTSLEAAVVYRRDSKGWDPSVHVPSNAEKAFNLRHRLITRNDR